MPVEVILRAESARPVGGQRLSYSGGTAYCGAVYTERLVQSRAKEDRAGQAGFCRRQLTTKVSEVGPAETTARGDSKGRTYFQTIGERWPSGVMYSIAEF